MICTIQWKENGGVEILACDVRKDERGNTESASAVKIEPKEFDTFKKYLDGMLKDKYVRGIPQPKETK